MMNKVINKVKLVIGILVCAIILTNIAYAATVEVVKPARLADKLHEGDQTNLTIKIKDYEDAKQISIETNLIPVGDVPLWDFGESNPVIDVNRYQQKIILDTTKLPEILTVSISGKVPVGENKVKCNDIVLTKLQETKLKFYEVRADDKLVKIESFELVIKIKEDFENTLQQVKWKEFDVMAREVRKVFDNGLTTEAQNIATEMKNMKRPDSLTLFGVLKVDNDLLLNGIVAGSIVVMFIIGYVSGSRKEDEEEES